MERIRRTLTGITALLPFLLFASCGQNENSIREDMYEERSHLVVETQSLCYWYDMAGGGFSRIIDQEGNDWVSYKTEPWGQYPASAASSFRGLPNLVFQGDDDGAGHPGHGQCLSRVEDGKIISETTSGLWRWSWEFFDNHAVLELEKTDPSRAYWFLYEGTPGGRFDPGGTWIGSDQGGPRAVDQDYYEGSILWGNFQWMYAGHAEAGGTFFVLQEEEDELMDMMSFLGNTDQGLDSPDGMTVFGFGREKEALPLLKGSQRFVIGIYPQEIKNKADHEGLAAYLTNKFLSQKP